MQKGSRSGRQMPRTSNAMAQHPDGLPAGHFSSTFVPSSPPTQTASHPYWEQTYSPVPQESSHLSPTMHSPILYQDPQVYNSLLNPYYNENTPIGYGVDYIPPAVPNSYPIANDQFNNTNGHAYPHVLSSHQTHGSYPASSRTTNAGYAAGSPHHGVNHMGTSGHSPHHEVFEEFVGPPIYPLSRLHTSTSHASHSSSLNDTVTRVSCRWHNCRILLDDITAAGIKRHLRQYHSSDAVEKWRGERGLCKWCNGGECGRELDLASLGKHIASVHLKSTAKICDRCQNIIGRPDSLKRHQRDHCPRRDL